MDELIEAKNSPKCIHFTSGIYGRIWDKNCNHPKKIQFYNFLNSIDINLDNYLVKIEYGFNTLLYRFIYFKFPFVIFSLFYKFIDSIK